MRVPPLSLPEDGASLPSGPNSTPKPEQAENGPKQCIGPQ